MTETPTTETTTPTAAPDAVKGPTAADFKLAADAIAAEALRKIKALKPADLETVQRVALSAAKLEWDKRTLPAEAINAKAFLRRIDHVDAQLKNLKATATKAANDTFWRVTEQVITRLSQIGFAAISRV